MPLVWFLCQNLPKLLNDDGSLNWENNLYGNNPYSATKQKYKSQTNNLVSNLTLSYQLLQGLEGRSSFGYTNMQVAESFIQPIAALNPAGFNPTGRASFTNNTINSWIIEPQITYQRMIGSGKIEVLAGTTFQRNTTVGQILGDQDIRATR